jgi:N-acetylmuramoyl-L-alanine amidase
MHCTATAQSAKVESIVNYWRNNLKWKNPGYHFIIEADGTVHNLQSIEKPSNGVRGHNSKSIHVSYIGGIDGDGKGLDNRTPEQKESQIWILKKLKSKFPSAKILGHRDFPGVKKECPSFDVKSWLEEVGLD